MKKLFLPALLALGFVANAQIKLPQPSQSATVSQTVGTADLSVKYARPSAKGREIFGKLLPYDKLWRTGANAATQFTTSSDIMVEGKKLAAGTYSLFSIPGASQFEVIFNKETNASEQNYSKEKDALRVTVPTQAIEMQQTMDIDFQNLTDSTATLEIAWEKTLVPVKIAVDINSAVDASIAKAQSDASGTMMQAANYLLGKGTKLDQALKLADLSVGSKETFRNVWTKAQILNKLGRYAEALPLAQKALSLGQSDNSGAFGFFKDGIEKGIADITSKIPAPVEVLKKKKK